MVGVTPTTSLTRSWDLAEDSNVEVWCGVLWQVRLELVVEPSAGGVLPDLGDVTADLEDYVGVVALGVSRRRRHRLAGPEDLVLDRRCQRGDVGLGELVLQVPEKCVAADLDVVDDRQQRAVRNGDGLGQPALDDLCVGVSFFDQLQHVVLEPFPRAFDVRTEGVEEAADGVYRGFDVGDDVAHHVVDAVADVDGQADDPLFRVRLARRTPCS